MFKLFPACQCRHAGLKIVLVPSIYLYNNIICFSTLGRYTYMYAVLDNLEILETIMQKNCM